MGETMLIFMMVCAERCMTSKVISEEAFVTLTGCLDYAVSLNCQSVYKLNGVCVQGQNRYFECHCRPRTIRRSEAGATILFRDPETETED